MIKSMMRDISIVNSRAYSTPSIKEEEEVEEADDSDDSSFSSKNEGPVTRA